MDGLSITKSELEDALSGKRVGIVGDVMLDKYIVGRVERMSPEAPVPILVHERSIERLGGAANVALNVHTLESKPFVCSVIGQDEAGEQLKALLQSAGDSADYLVLSSNRKTTTKTRLLGNNQHLLRLDSESQQDLSTDEENQLIASIDRMIDEQDLDVLIMQDYNKGVMTHKVIKHVIGACRSREIFVAVDPKFNRFFDYKYVNLFKPNLKETSEALGQSFAPSVDALNRADEALRARLYQDITMITLSAHGMYISQEEEPGQIVPTIPSEVNDVCGAGDAVMVVATLMFQENIGGRDVGLVCNKAGRIVCQKIGVAPVFLKEIIRQEE